MSEPTVQYSGGCHCGAIRFEFDASPAPELSDCNCSICRMSGFLHLVVPKERFRLKQGSADLIEYRFNTGAARHLFCRHCGIKSFYVPRSNPDGISVHARCVDGLDIARLTIRAFDGRNWDAAHAERG